MSKKPIEAPNYTQVPNVILDNIGLFKDAELRVVMAICRKTIGFHKTHDVISLSQFQVMTGLSRQGVINALDGQMMSRIIDRVARGNSFSYRIKVVKTVDQSEVVNTVDQSTTLTRNSQRGRPEVVNVVDTQKKLLKKERKRDRDNSRARAREATPDLFDDFWTSYPRKVGKKPARQKWRSKKLHEKPELAREIIADVERRSAGDEQWQDARYIPHPSTYLHQERWHDEILPEADTRGVPRPRGKAGLDTQARQYQAPRKRDGELSPAEYLERAGYSRAEAERLLGLPVGDDRDDQRRLPPAPSGDGR